MMKRQTIFLTITSFVFILTSILINGAGLAQGKSDFPEPNIPQNMIDLEHPEPGPDFEPLEEPILTLERALEFVLPHDQNTASWKDSWSHADVTGALSERSPDRPWQVNDVLEFERFTIGYLPGRVEVYRRLFNEKIWLAPEVEAQDGNVWSITIRGHVQARFIGGPNDDTVYDGITYLVSARTGLLLGIKTGLPIIDEKGNPILRDEYGNVIDEQGNIIWEMTK